LAVQDIGAGRIAFLGVDGLWRWRMDSAAETRDYDVFWQQLLIWLGGRVQQCALQCDRGSYNVGDTVRLTAVLPEGGGDLELIAYDGAGMTSPGIRWMSGSSVAEGEYVARQTGEVVFELRHKRRTVVEKIVQVRGEELEREHCGLNETLLLQLARETQGQVLSPADVPAVSSFVQPVSRTYTRKEISPLWHAPLIFLAILAGYGLELVLRRRYQLV
jgi:hypothetical protein